MLFFLKQVDFVNPGYAIGIENRLLRTVRTTMKSKRVGAF